MKSKKTIIMLGAVLLLLIVGNFFLNLNSTRDIDPVNSNISVEPTNEATEASNFVKINNIENALQDSMKMAMEDFKDKMRFPTYSIPIDNNDWDILNPRAFEPIPKALFNDEDFISSLSDVKIILEIESFIVNVDQDLPIKVKIISKNEDKIKELATANIRITSSDDPYNTDNAETISLQRTLQSSNNEPFTRVSDFSGLVPSSVLQSFGESNVHLVAELVFSDGTKAMSGAAIKLYESTANLESIGNAYVDGPHLIIPLDLFAQIPGYFRVQANLFDESGELPIAHLTEEIKTEEIGLISGGFKAHIVTLKEKGNPGPYLLKDIHISKIPTKPDYKPRYGNHHKETYSIAVFNFDLYDDEEYLNPEMQKRLAALEKISAPH